MRQPVWSHGAGTRECDWQVAKHNISDVSKFAGVINTRLNFVRSQINKRVPMALAFHIDYFEKIV